MPKCTFFWLILALVWKVHMLTSDFLLWIWPKGVRLSLIWSYTFRIIHRFCRTSNEKEERQKNWLTTKGAQWNLSFAFLCFFVVFSLSTFLTSPRHPLSSCWFQLCKRYISPFSDLQSYYSLCNRQASLAFLLHYSNVPLWNTMQDETFFTSAPAISSHLCC